MNVEETADGTLVVSHNGSPLTKFMLGFTLLFLGTAAYRRVYRDTWNGAPDRPARSLGHVSRRCDRLPRKSAVRVLQANPPRHMASSLGLSRALRDDAVRRDSVGHG